MADSTQSGSNLKVGIGLRRAARKYRKRDSTQSGSNLKVSDASQQNVYGISQRTGDISNQSGSFGVGVDQAAKSVVMDREIANLLIWLAEQQGISPEVALKKAVVTAAYIYDVTTSQGGKLLVQRKDNSVGEIVLK
jgi:hypothetical protein